MVAATILSKDNPLPEVVNHPGHFFREGHRLIHVGDEI
jgi:hypothetical protein